MNHVETLLEHGAAQFFFFGLFTLEQYSTKDLPCRMLSVTDGRKVVLARAVQSETDHPLSITQTVDFAEFILGLFGLPTDQPVDLHRFLNLPLLSSQDVDLLRAAHILRSSRPRQESDSRDRQAVDSWRYHLVGPRGGQGPSRFEQDFLLLSSSLKPLGVPYLVVGYFTTPGQDAVFHVDTNIPDSKDRTVRIKLILTMKEL